LKKVLRYVEATVSIAFAYQGHPADGDGAREILKRVRAALVADKQKCECGLGAGMTHHESCPSAAKQECDHDFQEPFDGVEVKLYQECTKCGKRRR